MRSKRSARASGRLAIASGSYHRTARASTFSLRDVGAVFDFLHLSVLEILGAQLGVLRVAPVVKALVLARRGFAQRIGGDQRQRDRRVRIADDTVRKIRRVDLAPAHRLARR